MTRFAKALAVQGAVCVGISLVMVFAKVIGLYRGGWLSTVSLVLGYIIFAVLAWLCWVLAPAAGSLMARIRHRKF